MSDSSKDVRKKVLGRKGEGIAAKLLKKLGMKIVERNYVTPFGEADIVALDGDEVVFAEVKTRTADDFGEPKEAVGFYKRRKYENIAKFYGLRTGEEPNARFDVVEVWADGRTEYYKNAF